MTVAIPPYTDKVTWLAAIRVEGAGWVEDNVKAMNHSHCGD